MVAGSALTTAACVVVSEPALSKGWNIDYSGIIKCCRRSRINSQLFVCAQSPTETYKADELRPDEGFMWGMLEFLPSHIPIPLPSFHLSYNYGVQQEPEVCALLFYFFFLKKKRERGWNWRIIAANENMTVDYYFWGVWMEPGSKREEVVICAVWRVGDCSCKTLHVESFLAEFAVWPEPLQRQRHLHHLFITPPPQTLCCSRCSPSERSRRTADRKPCPEIC